MEQHQALEQKLGMQKETLTPPLQSSPQITTETQPQEKIEKKEEQKEKKAAVKKTEAVVRGVDLRISKKHSMEIIRFIKGRTIEKALKILEKVLQKKQAIPFKGYEIPHRKGKGISEGRYPRNASREFLKLLKSLRANASVVNVDLSKAVLFGKANDASRPFKRGGSQRFKRVHIELWIREIAREKEVKKKIEKPAEVKK